MTRVWCLLLVVLHLGACCGSSLPNSVRECSIVSQFSSDYVRPLFQESVSNVSGCVSSERDTNGLPVFIVRYNSSSSSSSADAVENLFNVTVNLKNQADDEWNKGFVLVLVSSGDVQWKVLSFRIGRSAANQILQVSGSDHVAKDRRLKASVNRITQQFGPDADLVTWGRKRFGAVTSYIFLTDSTNYVDLILSTDNGGISRRCIVAPQLPLTTNVVVSSVQARSMDGCVVVANRGIDGKDVHIIELKPSKTGLSPKPLVTVNIGTAARLSVQVHLVLILQSQQTVRWHLSSQGIRGMVDIITDDDVDTDEVDVNNLRVAAERLRSLEGASLIEWVENKYGFPVSYTKTNDANFFELTVDPIQGQHKSETAAVSAVTSVSESTAVKSGALQVLLPRLSVVVCSRSGMTVVMRRDWLENLSIRRKQLTFADEQCVATENATHFLLHTTLTDCGSQPLAVHGETILYTNQVLVYKRGNSNGGNGGGGGGSGASQASLLVARLDVQCAANIYPRTNVPPVTDDKDEPQHQQLVTAHHQPVYEMSLYSDDFSHVILLPAEMKMDGTLFIETTLTYSEPSIGHLVKNCRLSRSSPKGNADRWNIISGGCGEIDSLHWYKDEAMNGKRRRFSFSLQEFQQLNGTLEFSCELTLCGTNDRYPSLAMCESQEKVCSVQQSQHDSDNQPDPGNQLDPNNEPDSVNGASRLLTATIVIDQPHQLITNDIVKENILLKKLYEPAVVYQQTTQQQQCKTQITHLIGLDTRMVVVVAFSAFIIGVLLMSSVWFIHARTGGSKRKQRNRKAVESAASTPSSLVPFLVHPIHS